MPQQISLTPTHFIPRTKATHERLHIRNAQDAQTVFEAVRLELLPMVKQRLSIVDCNLLQPGQVYCWEQENGEAGIERWTDGRRWGASRARENFLFYIENQNTLDHNEGSQNLNNYRIPHEQRLPWDFRHDERSSGFTKQTYSAWVILNPIYPPRRWNLTAYFSGENYPNLPTVDHYPTLSRISIPQGIYTTVESLLRRSERRSTANSASDPGEIPTRFGGHSVDQSSMLDPNEQTLHSPRPRGPDSGDRDLGYRQPLETETSATPSSPLPRSQEDERALSLFRLQL